MKILVTGGGGFLGKTVALRLAARGDTVFIFARGTYAQVEKSGIRTFRGDITNASSICEACKGIDAVIHCAAKAGVWGPYKDYFSINVIGTRNVIAACRQNNVKYLIHTSTPSVVYNGGAFRGENESLPYGRKFICAYARTKAIAEKEVLEAGDPQKLRVCALRPHLIWGIGDPHLLPRVIEAARCGKLRIVGSGKNRVDITHVENAALAHVLALDALIAGRACGKAFFLSQGEPVELWPWINELLERVGVHKIEKRISAGLAGFAGKTLETAYKLLPLKGEPMMTEFTAFELSHDHWFDISAARRELDYTPEISTEQGLDEYVRNYLKELR
jgi:2-alkyl-3-oxoalkanoate reductase